MSENERVTIIKLGGAAITDKDSPMTSRPEIIDRVFKEIVGYSGKLILVHGAGSFAHHLAKDYKLANGIDQSLSLDFQFKGISKIRNSLTKLHLILLESAQSSNLNTFTIPISSTMVSDGHSKESSLYFDTLDSAMRNGFIPVLFGDMVFDDSTSFRVVSGDRIIRLLCKHLQNQGFSEINVIFGTNVDGLFNKDPKFEDAKIIRNMNSTQLSEIVSTLSGSNSIDITGGMKGKIEEILGILQFNVTVKIVNLTIENRLRDLLQGNETIHSEFSN